MICDDSDDDDGDVFFHSNRISYHRMIFVMKSLNVLDYRNDFHRVQMLFDVNDLLVQF